MLKARRIVLGAPWSDAVNAMVAAFLQANGIEVLAHKAIGLVRNTEVGLLDEKTAYDMGREIDRPDADAVFLACGNWHSMGIIDALEKRLGKPVLSTNQVSLWAALRTLKSIESLPGCGTILRDHLATVPA